MRPWAKVGIFLLSVILVTGLGAWLYYRSFYGTPQYSLALLVEASKNGDRRDFDARIDTDAVVDDFIPQVMSKAAELYGRGLPPHIIERLAGVAEPLVPAVKERARVELPRLISERAKAMGDVPFVVMVVAADRYFDIRVHGDRAVAKSLLPDRPFEITMLKRGDGWQVVGVKDEQLSTDIARKIGQEIIEFAVGEGKKKTAEKLGVGNLADLLRQAEELIR
jgi:hypothetical protein